MSVLKYNWPALKYTLKTTFPRLRTLAWFIRRFPLISVENLQTSLYGHPPFNGQRKRREIVDHLFDVVKFDNVVETGTFLGNTTEYFCKIAASRDKIRVFSCDTNEFFLNFAFGRLRDFNNLDLKLSSSAEFLARIGKTIQGQTNFVYLDAHWGNYLPFRDEVEILSNWENTIILVDDFKVEGDPSYLYDDYGDIGVLNVDYIRDLLGGYHIFFPAHTSDEENATECRGYVFLTKSVYLSQILSEEDNLRMTLI